MKFFIFSLKSKIKIMPIICAILLIFMGGFYMIFKNLQSSKVLLEIYFADKDEKNYLITMLINNTKSTGKNIILSTSDDEKLSRQKLKNGEIDILISVPEGFYQSIINSENKSAVIEFSPNISQLQKGIFTSLTESSAHMLSYTQGNIYISDAMGDADVASRNQKLNSYFMSAVSSRYDNFEEVKNDESNLIMQVYICILIMTMIMASLKIKNKINFYSHFIVRGKNVMSMIMSEVCSNFVILFIISLVGMVILRLELSFIFIIKTMILCIFASFVLEASYSYLDRFSSFLILILCMVSTLSCGLFIPRLSIFTSMGFSPINLILADSIISWSVFLIYCLVLGFVSRIKYRIV
ncbi:putative membrane protein [Peptostreptococcaceae bacterium AS15]|nr:putative membrane protein [Peptostreptococcaceae bacterium AS15]